MAKKWKGYWDGTVQGVRPQESDDEEEIDVVGDPVPATCTQSLVPATPIMPVPQTACGTAWHGPSSPTAGTTAPSPPPEHLTHQQDPRIPPLHYNGNCHLILIFVVMIATEQRIV